MRDLPPEIWHHGVFVFLLSGDLARLGRANWGFYRSVKKWMGDKDSRRIRPLTRHDLNGTSHLSEPLKNVYSGCLRIWSACFHQAVTEFKHTHHIPTMKDDVAARTVDLLFTGSSTCFKKFTTQSSHDRLWQITTRYIAPNLLGFWDWMVQAGVTGLRHNEGTYDQYFLSGMHQFDGLPCDRDKLSLLHKIRPVTMMTKNQEVLGRLCSAIVPCAMTSLSRPVVEYTEYVLWTVWGQVWPINVYARNVGILRFADCVKMTPNLLNVVATPNTVPQHTIYTMLGMPGATLYHVQYPLSPSVHLPLMVHHKNVIMSVYVFRNQYVPHGISLQQKITYTLHGLIIEYCVINTQTMDIQKVHTCFYSETEPIMRESAEVMCWKYLPISHVQVHFQCFVLPTLYTRALKSVFNPKVIAHQSSLVHGTLANALNLPLDSIHVTPYHSIVNNCVWNVYIQC